MGCCSSTSAKYKDQKGGDPVKLEAADEQIEKQTFAIIRNSSGPNDKPLVYRKSILSLTKEEKDEYIRGVKLLKHELDSKGQNTYDKYVMNHIIASQQRGSIPPAAHRGPAFLPWHRVFILEFERDLQRVLKNPNFALPYWDWENDHDLKIWDPNFMGGNGGGVLKEVQTGPFASNGFLTYPDGKRLRRDFGASASAPSLPTLNEVHAVLDEKIYDQAPYNGNSFGFRNMLEGWSPIRLTNPPSLHYPPNLHNLVHVWIGGDMSRIPSAPNDPVFFLHHCNVDRIWALWQLNNPNELSKHKTTYPSTGAAQGHNLSDVMFPYREKAEDVLNFYDLGYTYDDILQDWPMEPRMIFPSNVWRQKDLRIGWMNMSSKGDTLYFQMIGVDEYPYIGLYNSKYGWQGPYLVSNKTMSDQRPTLEFDNDTLRYYVSDLAGQLSQYESVDGINWTTGQLVLPTSNPYTHSVNILSFSNKKFLYFSKSDLSIWCSVWDEAKVTSQGPYPDGIWSPPRRLFGDLKAFSLDITYFSKNMLFHMIVLDENKRLYHVMTPDHETWSIVQPILPDIRIDRLANLFATDKRLYLLAFTKDNSEKLSLGLISYDGYSWNNLGVIFQADNLNSWGGASLTSFNGRYYVSHVSSHNRIYLTEVRLEGEKEAPHIPLRDEL